MEIEQKLSCFQVIVQLTKISYIQVDYLGCETARINDGGAESSTMTSSSDICCYTSRLGHQTAIRPTA
jgi:hypothetical protein